MTPLATAVLFLQAVSSTPLVATTDSTPPDWEATCSPATGLTRVAFHSRSGDVHEDDMAVRIVWQVDSSAVTAIRKAWFKPTRFVSNTETKCSGIGAFELPRGRLLLWIRYDGRPGWDHLAVLLVDPAHHAVLDIIQDLGEIHGAAPMVLARAGQYEALLNNEWLLDRISGGEFGRPDWKALTVLGAQLHAQWRR